MRRGGDDQQAVAGLAVAFQAAQGVGVDARRYDPRDEILDGAGDLRRVRPAMGARLKSM